MDIKLRVALEASQKENTMKWISIKERLPHPKQLVVIAHRRSDVGIDVTCSNGSYARKWCKTGFYTHWLPLPPHPHKSLKNLDASTFELPYKTANSGPTE